VAIDGIRGDRRIQRRYPVALELEYKVMTGGAVIGSGTGKTGNISSGGVLFRTEDQLAAGPAVELSTDCAERREWDCGGDAPVSFSAARQRRRRRRSSVWRCHDSVNRETMTLAARDAHTSGIPKVL
jgi:hypothetical protein